VWVQQDANWNVTALVNGSGVVVERYVYDPFGVVTVLNASWGTLSGSAYNWLYGFQGERYDAASGLWKADDRWYSAPLQAWTSVDPSGLGPDINDYRFVGNDPSDATDPSGLQINPVQSIPPLPNSPQQSPHNDIMKDKLVSPDKYIKQDLMMGIGGPLAIGAVLLAPQATLLTVGGVSTAATADGHDEGQLGQFAVGLGGGRLAMGLVRLRAVAATDGPATPGATSPSGPAMAGPVRPSVAPGRTFTSSGTGTDLIRTTTVGGKPVQIKSGHGYNRPHTGPGGVVKDLGTSGLTMEQIEAAILTDLEAAQAAGVSLPKPGPGFTGPLERTVTVGGKTIGYRLVETPGGQISIPTYFEK
jgi:RHS repeat-associated protein